MSITRGGSVLTRTALAGVLLATVIGSTSGSAATTNTACPGVKHVGRWDQLTPPTFPSAPQDAANQDERHIADGWGAFTTAVDPTDPNRLFVSNGYVLMRSTDGGCTWQQAFSLYPEGAPTDGSTDVQPWVDPNYLIRDIEVAGPSGNGVLPHVYLALADFVEPIVTLEPVYIAASADGGTHWAAHPVTADTGPAGRYQSAARYYDGADVFASPSSPTTVYYGTVFYGDEVIGESRTYTLLVSRDAGSTWQIASAVPLESGGMSELVDPRDPKVVWRAYDTTGGTSPQLAALRSTNNGAAFRPVLQGAPAGTEVFDPPFITGVRMSSRTCVVSRSPAAMFLTTDDGREWARVTAPPPLDARSGPAYVEGASCTPRGRVVAMAGYQPQRFSAPPFTRSALYIGGSGRAWRLLASFPQQLADGSLAIAGTANHSVAYWFGFKDSSDTYGQATAADSVWLRVAL